MREGKSIGQWYRRYFDIGRREYCRNRARLWRTDTKVHMDVGRGFTYPLFVPLFTRKSTGKQLVSVVDDDESMRESLPDLLKELGFAARAFSSAEEFLSSDCIDQTQCLILDITMPGMSGPDLQGELKIQKKEIPIIFITARRDDTVRKFMLEQGAVECLFKPFSEAALLEAIHLALKPPD